MGGYLSKTLEWKDASELFASEANEHVFAALRAAITRLVESHEREAATTFATAVQFYTRAVSIERLASSREAHEYVEAGMNALESKVRGVDFAPDAPARSVRTAFGFGNAMPRKASKVLCSLPHRLHSRKRARRGVG